MTHYVIFYTILRNLEHSSLKWGTTLEKVLGKVGLVTFWADFWAFSIPIVANTLIAPQVTVFSFWIRAFGHNLGDMVISYWWNTVICIYKSHSMPSFKRLKPLR